MSDSPAALSPTSRHCLVPARPDMNLPLTDRQLSTVVVGHHLEPTSLRELLDRRPTLLVFLRHYG